MHMFSNTRRGFTLIELLVVILIISILAAIALPQYQKAVVKSRNAQLKNYVQTIAQAQEAYYLEHGSYAANFKDLDIQLPLSSPGTTSNRNVQPCNKIVPGNDSMLVGENIQIFFNNSSTEISTGVTIIATHINGPYHCKGIGRKLGKYNNATDDVPSFFCIEMDSSKKPGSFCPVLEKGTLKYTDPWGTRFYTWQP